LLDIAQVGLSGCDPVVHVVFPRAMRVRLGAPFVLTLPFSQAVGSPCSATVLKYLDCMFGLTGWQTLIGQGVPAMQMGLSSLVRALESAFMALARAPASRRSKLATENIARRYGRGAEAFRYEFRLSTLAKTRRSDNQYSGHFDFPS